MAGYLTEDQMKEMLKTNSIGRIGCHDGAKNYVVPVGYLYDGSSILIHSPVGRKIRMMRKHPDVCFEVDEIKNFRDWKSVIAWGRYVELNDEEEKKEAMQAFVDQMMNLKLYDSAPSPETMPFRMHPRSHILSTVIYKIEIEKMTGRFENSEGTA